MRSEAGLEEMLEAVRHATLRLGGRVAFTYREDHGEPEPGPALEEAGLPGPLVNALNSQGVTRLYKYQYEALETFRRGRDIVIVSGTGTGKTEAFLIPVVEALSRESSARGPRAVIIYPTKALARDQIARMERVAAAVGLRLGVLDGDTPRSMRSKIYADPPDILVTNPDLLHYGMAFSGNIKRLVRNTEYVVLDEFHVYRGVFGSHVRWVLYRLERLAGGSVGFVMAGATIGNPVDLGRSLTGREPDLIKGPPRRRGSVVHLFVDSGPVSRWSMSAAIIAFLASRGVKVLGFVDSQQMAELIARIARRNWRVEVAVHRAGLPAEVRREVEDSFKEGRINAVVATPTMELGIDIGDLDAITMAHLPRSFSSYLQRAGRAGRRGRTGLVATVMADDAIEAYFLRRPMEYFSQEPDPAYVEPGNREIARLHLAAHLLAKGGEPLGRLPLELREAVNELEALGVVRVSGGMVYPEWRRARDYVEAHGGIRAAGPSVRIVDEVTGKQLGSREVPAALYDLYPGAIYYLAGGTYLVLDLDLEALRTKVRRVSDNIGYYTKPIYTIDVIAIHPLEDRKTGPLRLVYADVKLTVVVEGYLAKDEYSGEVISETFLDEPVKWSYWTKGVVTRYPNPGLTDPEDAISAYHALEHALIHAARPVVGASDTDLGGVSYPSGHIVIYDSAPGGNGASRLVFERFERVVDIAENILAGCSCEDGCPKCIFSPYCGVNNRFLSRRKALRVLQAAHRLPRELKLGTPQGSPIA